MSRNEQRKLLLRSKRELRKEFNIFGTTLEKINYKDNFIFVNVKVNAREYYGRRTSGKEHSINFL